jgi:hypothetical protein
MNKDKHFNFMFISHFPYSKRSSNIFPVLLQPVKKEKREVTNFPFILGYISSSVAEPHHFYAAPAPAPDPAPAPAPTLLYSKKKILKRT